jgi:two-component system chemotaxis response regulator CheY
MRALIIDDSRAMRALLSSILRKFGVEADTAANGAEGLQRLSRPDRPELVLVDWNMPEMDGLEFVRRVRADPTLGGVRLVMVTTETEFERIETAMQAGIDEYVMKPFTAEMIAHKLELLGFAA